MMVAIVLLVFVVVLALFAIGIYNRLVALRQQVRAGWAQIEVMLKRRWDLIPNLVESVKGYAAHEKQTLERVIAARNSAAAVAGNPAQVVQADNALSGALRQLFAVAEAYPDLKANQNFMQLQQELSSTENRISSQRQGYNDLVATYNTSVQTFPNNIFAGMFGFAAETFFQVDDATQREAPAVKF